MWDMNCPWWWGPGYFFGGPWGWMVGLLFWALVIYGAFRLISNLTNRSFVATKKEETALEILRRRYAKGEIDGEEFAQRKNDLTT